MKTVICSIPRRLLMLRGKLRLVRSAETVNAIDWRTAHPRLTACAHEMFREAVLSVQEGAAEPVGAAGTRPTLSCLNFPDASGKSKLLPSRTQ